MRRTLLDVLVAILCVAVGFLVGFLILLILSAYTPLLELLALFYLLAAG